ncbi:MAG TPA: PP2C family protein-serine/threonine phosphatase [Candidatus Binatia bacterium]|nr:PP2C family protein-serine/threonine phosphatase [Candidatus Binatia bacterium]
MPRSLSIRRLVRRQQSFVAIAVAIYAGLWAADRPADLSSTIIYTLPLCNLIVLIQDYLGGFYRERRALQSWAIYLGLVLTIAILGVAVVNVIQFPLHKLPRQTLRQFLRSGWKLPFMATMIVGVSTELYRRARERLESRNRQLQQVIEQETARRERQEQELQQAREIQQSLMPKEIPQVPGFEIDGAWEPARMVGGDYFDVIRLSKTKLGICIADVVGKSVSAALLMANVQAVVRAFAHESTTPSALCSRINSVLSANIGIGKFVTFFYAVLDAQTRALHYTNAGHLLPILLRAEGEALELENGGAVLGVFPEWKYEDSFLQFQPGDRLLLFTDGITEAGTGEEEFGEVRMIADARACIAGSAAEIKTRILTDAREFSDQQLRDDATLIVVAAQSIDKTASPTSKERFATPLPAQA